jgi:hypothetical protein
MQRNFQIRFGFSCSDNLKSKIENLKWLGLSVIPFVLVVAGAVAEAQQPTKVPRIGYLTGAYLSAISPRTEAFGRGCASLDMWRAKTLSLSGDLRREN